MVSTSTPTEPQLGDALPATMNQINRSYDRIRLLVLGKKGVGKLSLINHIFNDHIFNLAEVSEYTAEEADVNKEIFPGNDSFVLHIWNGYESGEVENLRILMKFIDHRTGNANVRGRLHAIWLCITTPFSGGRIPEVGYEKIFRVVYGRVPIIAVFTKCDYLVMKKELELYEDKGIRTEDEIHSLARSLAYQSFDKDCIIPMKKVNSDMPCVFVSVNPQYEDTLRNLVKTTLLHINPRGYPLPSGFFQPDENQAVEPPSQSSRRGPAPWILASRKLHMPQKPLDADFLLRMAGLRRQFDGASLRSTNSSLQILGSFVSLDSTVPSDSCSVLSLPLEDEFPPTPVFRDEIPKELMTKVESSVFAAQTLRGSFASSNSSSAHHPPTPTGPVRRGYWNRRGDHLTPDGYVVFPPSSMQYPAELRMYPFENEGYQDHNGVFITYVRRPELPQSLWTCGNPPERPYESFVSYL